MRQYEGKHGACDKEIAHVPRHLGVNPSEEPSEEEVPEGGQPGRVIDVSKLVTPDFVVEDEGGCVVNAGPHQTPGKLSLGL